MTLKSSLLWCNDWWDLSLWCFWKWSFLNRSSGQYHKSQRDAIPGHAAQSNNNCCASRSWCLKTGDNGGECKHHNVSTFASSPSSEPSGTRNVIARSGLAVILLPYSGSVLRWIENWIGIISMVVWAPLIALWWWLYFPYPFIFAWSIDPALTGCLAVWPGSQSHGPWTAVPRDSPQNDDGTPFGRNWKAAWPKHNRRHWIWKFQWWCDSRSRGVCPGSGAGTWTSQPRNWGPVMWAGRSAHRGLLEVMRCALMLANNLMETRMGFQYVTVFCSQCFHDGLTNLIVWIN